MGYKGKRQVHTHEAVQWYLKEELIENSMANTEALKNKIDMLIQNKKWNQIPKNETRTSTKTRKQL